MAKKLAFERYIWFLDQARREKYPNAPILAEHFEISVPQAQRDITFMREFLNAPLTFDHYSRGYLLKNNYYQLPITWIKSEELLLFALAKELLSDADAKGILDIFFGKIAHFSDLDPERVKKIVSYKGMRIYRLQPGTLNTILSAILQNREIEILYDNVFEPDLPPHPVTTTPVHLLFFSGNWYLIGVCADTPRTFSLSRIKEIKVTGAVPRNHLD